MLSYESCCRFHTCWIFLLPHLSGDIGGIETKTGAPSLKDTFIQASFLLILGSLFVISNQWGNPLMRLSQSVTLRVLVLYSFKYYCQFSTALVIFSIYITHTVRDKANLFLMNYNHNFDLIFAQIRMHHKHIFGCFTIVTCDTCG